MTVFLGVQSLLCFWIDGQIAVNRFLQCCLNTIRAHGTDWLSKGQAFWERRDPESKNRIIAGDVRMAMQKANHCELSLENPQ